MFLACSPERLYSDLSRQPKSWLSLNWQVLKVLTVKFQASALDQCHHLLINLSCKSVGKPLDAQCCNALEEEGVAAFRHYDCAYTVFTRFWCTPTRHVQPKPNSDVALKHWHQWRSSHLDILDLSRGGRIRGVGKIGLKQYIAKTILHLQKYSGYKVFRVF